MTENLVTALEITAIGMSLVFASIVLLWVVMAALVRFSTPGKTEEKAGIHQAEEVLNARRRAAAAAAVAIALSNSTTEQAPRELVLPPTAIVSAWQAVLRSGNVRQRGPIRR